MKRKAVKEFLWAVAFVLVAVFLISLAAKALRPPRVTYGALWDPYLSEPKDSLDYLYLGSSFVYCDVDPVTVYDETGLTGFVLAAPEQTPALSYWYLREALKTQTPGLVVYEATGLQFERYKNYTEANIVYMPQGENRWGAAMTAAEPELDKVGLIFDLYNYHSRWTEVTPLDLACNFGLIPNDTKGFTDMEEGTGGSVEGESFPRETVAPEVYRENLQDLAKIAALCREKNILLAVVYHPTCWRFSPEICAQMEEDIQKIDPSVTFYNWGDKLEEIGLDPAIHFYDPGHCNGTGARIFSRWLGGQLLDMGLTPRDQEASNTNAWEALTANLK